MYRGIDVLAGGLMGRREVLKERLVFHNLYGSAGEGEAGSSCRPNARCLRRPVIRAADEFRAVPLPNDRKIIEKLREFDTSLRPINTPHPKKTTEKCRKTGKNVGNQRRQHAGRAKELRQAIFWRGEKHIYYKLWLVKSETRNSGIENRAEKDQKFIKI